MISTPRLFALGMIPIKIEDWQMESTIIQAFFKTVEEGTICAQFGYVVGI